MVKLLGFILICIVCFGMCQTFSQFKIRMQKVALQISTKLESYYKQWCIEGIQSCETLTTNACIGVQHRHCDQMFPKQQACMYSGLMSTNSSNIKFPPDIDYKNLSEQQIRFICASAKLQNTFKNLSSNNHLIVSMYVGSNRGLFREYPGNYHGDDSNKCGDYDPRYRPWYTAAASGAKNVIILIDKSSSMTKNGELQIAKSAVISLIDTLSINDNLAVIAFQNITQDIGSSKLSKVTNEYKLSIQESVSKIQSYQGQTNFQSAFKRGIDMVKYAIKSGDSGCSQSENVFLLLTDGNPTQNKITSDDLILFIKGYSGQDSLIKKQIIIFIYALGSNVNAPFLLKLSCNFQGIVIIQNSPTIDGSNSAIATKLQQFYTYLAVGVKFSSPIWTEPYNDYFGYGRMVTVSMPVYYVDSFTNLTTMIGVAALDILMAQFDKYGYSEEDIMLRLIGQSACQKNRMTYCQLQALRNPSYRCNITNCTIDKRNDTKCNNLPLTKDIFKQVQLYKNNDICCGITYNDFIWILSGSGVAFTLIVFLLLCRNRIKEAYKKRQCCPKIIQQNLESIPSTDKYEMGSTKNRNNLATGEIAQSASHFRSNSLYSLNRHKQ